MDETESLKTKSRKGVDTHVRFTEEELSRIESDSALTGKSIPQLLKRTYFGKRTLHPIVAERDLKELLLSLSRIGNNINQMTRKLHSENDKSHLSYVNVLAEELQMLRNFFLGKYGFRFSKDEG